MDSGWTQTIVGTVLGLLAPPLIQLLRGIVRRIGATHLVGTWYEYHYSALDNSELRREEWTISLGWGAKLRVRTRSLPDEKIVYVGWLRADRDSAVVTLAAATHQEEVSCRFRMPIPGNDRLIEGIWLGTDFKHRLTAGAAVLSRDLLSQEEAARALAQRFETVHDSYGTALRVAPSYASR